MHCTHLPLAAILLTSNSTGLRQRDAISESPKARLYKMIQLHNSALTTISAVRVARGRSIEALPQVVSPQLWHSNELSPHSACLHCWPQIQRGLERFAERDVW